MKTFIFSIVTMIALALSLEACSLLKKAPAPIQAVVAAAQGAICPLAQELADEGGAKLADMTGAPNPLSCGSDLYQPLVNAQICDQPVPASIAPQLHGLHELVAKGSPEWKTIGDIPRQAFKQDPGLKAQLVSPKGVIISGIVCPLGVGVGMGVFSSAIPKDCQGPNNLSASDADKALVGVCQTLTAALP